jgi:hypothetical protein
MAVLGLRLHGLQGYHNAAARDPTGASMCIPDRPLIRELLAATLTEAEHHEIQRIWCVIRASGRMLTQAERGWIEELAKTVRERTAG